MVTLKTVSFTDLTEVLNLRRIYVLSALTRNTGIKIGASKTSAEKEVLNEDVISKIGF